MQKYLITALFSAMSLNACTKSKTSDSLHASVGSSASNVTNCLFVTADSARLAQGPKFTTFKISRMSPEITDQLVAVNVSELKDTKTGKIYQQNATFNDVDDGGNVLIWIEDMSFVNGRNPASIERGQVVARIGDGNVESCLVSE